MPTLPEGARAIDPEAEARRLIAQRHRNAATADWHVVVDGIHHIPGDDGAQDFVYARIRVTTEQPPPGPMRSDLGDQLAEVVRANWPQGEVAP